MRKVTHAVYLGGDSGNTREQEDGTGKAANKRSF
jgi:hypothetical protein